MLTAKARQPVPRVHVDFTLKSGPARLQAVLPEDAAALSKTPFAVIQVSPGPPVARQLKSINCSDLSHPEASRVGLHFIYLRAVCP